MKKLAIITTHPIQYHAPWFKLLSTRGRVEVMVFYTWGQLEHGEKFDPDFGKNIEWDIPLLEGYPYTFVKNTSTSPGSDHFRGIDNPSITAQINHWNPDAVLVFGWKFKSHLKVLRYYKGRRRILFRGDSNLLDEASNGYFKRLSRRLFLTWIYRHIDIALYVGSANKDYYKASGLGEKKLVFAPHAIDNHRLAMGDPNILRSELQIGRDDLVFLFAGKLEAKKNPLLLLHAFIDAQFTSAHLIIVGNGLLERELKDIVSARDLSLQQHIHFLDFQNQGRMPDVYACCTVFVLPSRGPGETWGLSVNEAMAAGRAVLVSNKCGCATDLVVDDLNGYIFKSDQQEDLVKRMLQFSQKNNTELSVMGNHSKNIIQKWSFEKICEAIEQCS